MKEHPIKRDYSKIDDPVFFDQRIMLTRIIVTSAVVILIANLVAVIIVSCLFKLFLI